VVSRREFRLVVVALMAEEARAPLVVVARELGMGGMAFLSYEEGGGALEEEPAV